MAANNLRPEVDNGPPMDLADFDYDLPAELIAQEPAPQRASSRLLYVDRFSSALSHRQFSQLPSLLPPECLLVLNDTRVVPARLRGRKHSGGGIEVLLIQRVAGQEEVWQVLCKGGQNVRPGTRVEFGPELQAEWITQPEAGRGTLRFFHRENFQTLLERFGEMPLPPYIKRQPGGQREDRERYQTVYAHTPGAVAAPTAGLHFTAALMQTLRQQGIETVFLTLHVGIGTFLPVRVKQAEAHQMEKEAFSISQEAARQINQAKAAGCKIVAVGTTTTRALESARHPDGQLQAGAQHTQLFIYPGFRFQIIDGLITNFHLPRSTLLMLVSAFAGRERILNAYAEAVAQRYRFYSYGDAMLIL